jgi:hypothetical protein
VIAAHWDALESFIPALQAHVLSTVPRGVTLMALDERTAIIGNGWEWEASGAGSVTVRRQKTSLNSSSSLFPFRSALYEKFRLGP